MIGRVAGMEINHKPIEIAKKGQDVAIRIELPTYETPKMVGRHFEPTDEIVSQVIFFFFFFPSFCFFPIIVHFINFSSFNRFQENQLIF